MLVRPRPSIAPSWKRRCVRAAKVSLQGHGVYSRRCASGCTATAPQLSVSTATTTMETLMARRLSAGAVVDASVAVKWVLPEEHSEAALRLLESGIGLT